MWTIDGEVFGSATGAAVIRPDGSKLFGTEFMRMGIDEVHAGASQVEPRLAMMDELGIHAQIVYPNVVGFGGQRFANVVDPELKLLCATIYNDAMAEIQDASGGRMFPMAILPWWDIDAAVAEVARIHALGLRGVNTNADPHYDGCPDLGERAWDPLWEACADLAMPVNFHIGGSATSMSWFGIHAVAVVRRRAQARARFVDGDDLELPDDREPAAVRRARAPPDAPGGVGRERPGLGAVPPRRARLRGAGVRAGASPSTCRCRRPPTSAGRCTRATGSSATACAAPSTRSASTTSCSRPTSRTRRASTRTAWRAAPRPLAGLRTRGTPQDPEHQRGDAVPDPAARSRMTPLHRPASCRSVVAPTPTSHPRS